MNIDKYIKTSRLNILAITSDVSKGIISRQDIEIIIKEIDSAVKKESIPNPYIKTSYFPKINKQWDKKYLDYLVSVAASSECFNKDYLLYLADVSEYVRGGLKRVASRFFIFVILLLLAFVIGNLTASSNANSLKKELESKKTELNISYKEKSELEEKISSYADYDDIKAERDSLQEKCRGLEDKLTQITNIASETALENQ